MNSDFERFLTDPATGRRKQALHFFDNATLEAAMAACALIAMADNQLDPAERDQVLAGLRSHALLRNFDRLPAVDLFRRYVRLIQSEPWGRSECWGVIADRVGDEGAGNPATVRTILALAASVAEASAQRTGGVAETALLAELRVALEAPAGPEAGSGHPESPETGSGHPESPEAGSGHPESPEAGSGQPSTIVKP